MKLLPALWAVSIQFYTALWLGHSPFRQFLKHGKAVGCSPLPAISPKWWYLHNPWKCLPSSHLQADLDCLSPDCTQNVHYYRLQQELYFMECFWLQPQAHLVQPRPLVGGVDIQYNSYTVKYICLCNTGKVHYTPTVAPLAMHCPSDSLQEKAKIVNKNKDPLDQGGTTQQHMKGASPLLLHY